MIVSILSHLEQNLLAIAPNFEIADNFSEGLAKVAVNGKCGYINLTGETIIKPQFDWGDRFSESLARVKINGKYGYIRH